MTQSLTKFLSDSEKTKHATQNGTRIHAMLKNIVIDNTHGHRGDIVIINKIKTIPNLCQYFGPSAKTEVPIAGYINGVFLSRRIDRLVIDDTTKHIYFIDYKTDINKAIFTDKYTKQINEYANLLKSAYPEYKITGYILWLHDWHLEQIVVL